MMQSAKSLVTLSPLEIDPIDMKTLMGIARHDDRLVGKLIAYLLEGIADSIRLDPDLRARLENWIDIEIGKEAEARIAIASRGLQSFNDRR